jgi:hypothetical protein
VLEDDNSENEQVLHQLSAQYDMMPWVPSNVV